MIFKLDSIKLKLVLVNGIILVCVIFAFYFTNYYFSNRIISSLLNESVNQLSNATINSLELAMLTEEKKSLNEILKNIASEEEIQKIFIFDNEDSVKFSSEDSEIGTIIPETISHLSGLSSNIDGDDDHLFIALNNEQDKKTMRHIKPIFKKEACYQCHTESEEAIGYLTIDLSLGFVETHLSWLKWFLILLILGTSFVLIVVGNIIVDKFLMNKLYSIMNSISIINRGNLNERIAVYGNDEIDTLAINFNEMISKVNALMNKEHEDKIYFENLINSIDDGILVINMDYTISHANKAILKETGYNIDEVVNHFCHFIKGEGNVPCKFKEHKCPLNSIRKDGKPVRIIQEIQLPGNKRKYYEIYASPMKDASGEVKQIIEVIRDISERKNLEMQLIQSEKLASIGILTTNVAHEINNPMASVSACAEGLQKRLGSINFYNSEVENTFKEYLEIMKKAAFRCKSYTDKLLSFSTPSALKDEVVSINIILKEITSLLMHQAQRSHKTIVLELADNIPNINGDQTQLSQIFMNLITNGLDAVEKSGIITVRSLNLKNGLKVVVEDNGTGIDSEVQQKIFEPFFTTKEKGKGTGLGLYISKSVIERHGGSIKFRNSKSGGAVFTVFIPRE